MAAKASCAGGTPGGEGKGGREGNSGAHMSRMADFRILKAFESGSAGEKRQVHRGRGQPKF